MAANTGRRARPRGLKVVEGRAPGRDSGGRPIPPEPGFVRLPPEPPSILTGEALALWHRVVPELARLRLTKPVDAEALTAYCLTWQRLVDAQAVVAVEGLLYEGKQGLVRHPALGVVIEASKELRAWCAEFGFTPAAEVKVARTGEAAGGGDAAADPFGVAPDRAESG